MIEEFEKRNKLIRLADRSEAGWKAVDEYTAIEDGSDADDDRKMRQAEQSAITKKEAKRRPSRLYNNLTTGPVQHHYYEQQKGQNFRSYRVHLASKPDFSSTRIHKDSPATFVDNQATCPQRQGFIQPFNPFIQPTQPLQPEEGQQILRETKKP